MKASEIAIEVRVVAERCAVLIVECRRTKAEEVRRTAVGFEPLIKNLWKSMLQQFELYLDCGSPTSIMRLVGLSDLEKPFNRILKWCSDERGEHGLGREFLIKLCTHLGFAEMTKSLDGGEEVEFWSEEKVDGSGNMPDLVVRTRNPFGAALMLENKVKSGASGDQYVRYPEWFPRFAGHRKALAVLCTRDKQERPPQGWNKFISHDDLAKVLRDVAKASKVPTWGRIVAIQCAVTLENVEKDVIAELIRATKHKSRIGILDWQRVLSFQPSAILDKPWEQPS